MLRIILLVLATILFALLALNVITTHQFRWEMGGLAIFAASFLFPADFMGNPWVRRGP
jgi:hypothetical protein